MALGATVLSALSVSGCHAPARSSPGAVYQGIYADLLHGNLEVARAKAAQARQEFSAGHSGGDATWELQFRLLEADILLRQNHPQQVMALLAESVPFPANGDLAIRRRWLRGLAYRASVNPPSRTVSYTKRAVSANQATLP